MSGFAQIPAQNGKTGHRQLLRPGDLAGIDSILKQNGSAITTVRVRFAP